MVGEVTFYEHWNEVRMRFDQLGQAILEELGPLMRLLARIGKWMG